MILKPFFRRHFWLTAIVFALTISAASYLSHYLTHIERSEFFRSQGDLVFELVNQQSDKIAFAKQLNVNNRALKIPFEVDIVRDGTSLLTGEPHDVPEQTSVEERRFVHEIFVPESAKFVVVYSFVRANVRHGASITFVVMMVAIILASTLSIFLQFWSFRDKADLAKNVLSRMQQGDLKARFPTSKLDEVGQIMGLFNQMADEIERLVEQLKQNEKARLQLLQELTHDLRTPVSSLRNLIETLRFGDERLKEKDRLELMDLAYHETEYLTRLVEDLLFLALVLEPKYKTESGEVDLPKLISAQLGATSANYPNVKYEVLGSLSDQKSRITGNPHLMQRLIRNALENAFSFARSKVQVKCRFQDGFLHIAFRDDGPGLSPESLDSYGKKRSTRYQGAAKQDGRLSVGLGSVIIHAIVTAHGGTASINNLEDSQGKILGAELNIKIRTTGDVPNAQA